VLLTATGTFRLKNNARVLISTITSSVSDANNSKYDDVQLVFLDPAFLTEFSSAKVLQLKMRSTHPSCFVSCFQTQGYLVLKV